MLILLGTSIKVVRSKGGLSSADSFADKGGEGS